MQPSSKKRKNDHQSAENTTPRKKRYTTKCDVGSSPARPSDQWPKLDWSQLPHSSTIEKIISTGNWEYLRSEASRLYPSTQQVPCSIDLTRLASGRQNVIFEISFSNGTYWVVRVSLTQDVEEQMLSEVATINLLLEKTSIPVPSVLGSNCHNENQFGFPYMFMSALPGRTLEKTFALSVPEKYQRKVAGQLARYWHELSQVTFDQIGRIWGGPGADEDLRIISLPSFGAQDCAPGLYAIGPFKTSGAYFSGIRKGMNDLLRAQHRDAWPQWSAPCQALTDVIPSLTIAPRRRSARFPLAHIDFHYGNVLLDDDYNVTGIIDWTNAHTVPVEVFAAWPEIMIPGSASNEVKAAIVQFRDLFTKALKKLESTAEAGSMSFAISGLLKSSMLTVVHRWLFAVRNVPHTLRAASAHADMVLRALYGDGATVENYKSVRRNKKKRTSGGLGASGSGSPGTG
jgi:aminoglycoside phosphotransferase